MTKDSKTSISLCVNGKRYTVGREFPPATSLLDFLRKSGVSTGTKGCCLEGGCGVCLVTAKFEDPVKKVAKTYSVNSCCLQLYSCDGLDITTVEGLGNTSEGVHPIQDRLAKFDGAQCGYCSPGQVMNMYGLLKNNARPKMQEVENAFDTTICRCTGYRSILDAMKSFAVDAPASLSGGVIDIENLDGKVCCRNKQSCADSSNNRDKQLEIITESSQWIRPTNMSELIHLLKEQAGKNYRLVFGNTGFGLFRELAVANYQTLIDIRGIKDLYTVNLGEKVHITLGANLTLTNLKELFETINDPGVPYGKEFASHLQYVTSTGVRNLGSWAGNLMLKHLHKEFPSDVFTIMETVGATINIVDEKGTKKNYSLLDFLSLNMNGKIIVSVQLPKYERKDVFIRTFKTSPRLQLSTAYVSSGFNFQINIGKDYLIEKRPTIVIQGINADLVHASQTEAFLTNKKLSDPATVKEAFQTLSAEMQANSDNPLQASWSYRNSLAVGHFYKFILGICKDKCDIRYLSGGLDLERPISSGTHDYGTPNEDIFPVSKPLMKLTAKNLTTGEVRFVNDSPIVQGQLYAAVVLSTEGNAKIEKIDVSKALEIPGVVTFITASDIPGQNNWKPSSLYGTFTEELLISERTQYAGQPIGIIVAEDENISREAVKAVNVTYSDIKPVIVDVMDSIKQGAFFDALGPYTTGNAKAALESAPNRIKGNTRSREQYHFQLENQVAICTPTDLGGMDVYTTTQWTDATQETVAQVLGILEASVTVETQRLGGAFGCKILCNLPVAGMAAVAAHKVKKPVKLNLDLQTNMQFQGDRMGYYFEYEIGCDNDGKLLAIVATAYGDCGYVFQPECDEHTYNYVDSDDSICNLCFGEGNYKPWRCRMWLRRPIHAEKNLPQSYFCPNWSWTVQPCKTNKPVITFMRAPGSAASIFAMQCMMDHVATYLKKDHLEVCKINLFTNGQTTLGGMLLEHSLAREVVEQLETDIKYVERKKQVEDFNKANRWRKRGLHVMPSRYSMMYTKLKHSTSVTIYHGDGSVIIAHGGIDVGQGINTKAIQTCSYKLGIHIDKIKVARSSSVINANSDFTGGSTVSELICNAVINCCDMLTDRMSKVKESLTNPTWEELVTKSYTEGVNLTAQYWPEILKENYSCYTACCAEVEVDTLTGQYQIVQVDYVYDCGTSLNPELDLGQLEGAFVMGCGLFLLESMIMDPKTGKALTDGTNTYKPPLTKDIPIKLNVKFLRNNQNPLGVLGSKAVGESPVSHGTCPMLALKRAVEAARAEIGVEGWFPFHAPATVEKIQQTCLNNISKYTLTA